MPASDADHDRHAQAERLSAAVREAGAIALQMFRGKALKSWTKDKNSPVCEADIAVNDLLHQRLSGEGFGWLSEESADDPARLSARRVWVIDPIDGTRAYIAGLPDWSIAAALVEEGRPVVAVLFAPVTDEFFVAVQGSGATRNGIAIRVTDADALAGSRLGGPKRSLEQLQDALPDIMMTPRVHSLALRMTRVAHGALDVAIATANSRDWDLAAADLLVHEAGGILTTFAGQALTYNRAEPVHQALLAAGRQRHKRLLSLMRERRIAFA